MCNDVIENKTSFELTSPGYPNSYPANEDCEIVVRFNENATVKLTFLEFFLEWEANCQYLNPYTYICIYVYIHTHVYIFKDTFTILNSIHKNQYFYFS